MPRNSHSGAIENVKHNYTITSQKLLSSLGLSGHWIDSVSLESYSFNDGDLLKAGKKVHLVVRDKLEA